MALPTYVGGGSTVSAASGAVTASMPSSLATGDLLILLVESSDPSVTVSSGWEPAPNSPVTGTTYATTLSVYYQWYSGSAPARSVSAATDHVITSIHAFRGLNKSGNPFNFTASTTGGTTSSGVFPGGTTRVADSLILVAAGHSRDSTGTFFSSWANASLGSVTERLDTATASGNGGGLALTTGTKATAGTVDDTTATVSVSSSQWVGWVGAISANLIDDFEPGALTLAGGETFFGILGADEGTLALAGGDAILGVNTFFDADDEALTLTGGDATLRLGTVVLADAEPLTLAGEDAVYHYTMPAVAGQLTFTGGDTDILAPTPEIFRVGVMVDLIPSRPTGNYQRYTERLRFNGTTIPVKSWSFTEGQGDLAGRLQVELANVADRSLVAHNTPITFEVGEWDGSQFVYTTLLDTGELRNTQYNISAQGVGPADTFTITAASRMEDALNLVPNNNIVYYDSSQLTANVGDFEGIYLTNGTYVAPTVNSVSNLTWQGLLSVIPGFDDIRTNIPDFPVKMVQFQAGVPYINAINGIIGMFEPILSAIDEGGNFVLYIQDGTSVIASAMPDPREVTIERASSLGLSDEVPRIGGLQISSAVNRRFYDYITVRTETETDSVVSPESGSIDTTTVTTYYDFYRFSNPDEPVKTEIKSEVVTESDSRTGFTIRESDTRSYYDSLGNIYFRYTKNKALIPNPIIDFVLDLRDVSTSYESFTYAVHPYDIKSIYRKRYVKSVLGYYYIDTENTQLDEPYKKYAVDAYRAGNVNEDMDIDWGWISFFVETVQPLRKNQARVRVYEVDCLTPASSVDNEIVRDGAVGSNGYVDEQRNYYIYREGQTSLNGQVQSVNMGELPLTMAVSLGRKILRNLEHATERVNLNLIGIDTTLVRGMGIRAKGRANEDLGNYIIDGRSMTGSENGYSMTIEARSAKRN